MRRRGKRRDQDPDIGELTVTVLPDGRVILPRGWEWAELARALGDERAAGACEKAAESKVILGEKMCG